MSEFLPVMQMRTDMTQLNDPERHLRLSHSHSCSDLRYLLQSNFKLEIWEINQNVLQQVSSTTASVLMLKGQKGKI